MLLIIVRSLYAFVCAGAVVTYVSAGKLPKEFADYEILAFFVLLLITQFVTLVDIFTPRKRIESIAAIYLGLLIGVLLSYLLLLALELVFSAFEIEDAWKGGVGLIFFLILPYLCMSVLLQTKDDFRFVIPYVEFARELKGARPLVLDSSALIDGRIADVIDTNIIDSQIIVPNFVLHEVQDIADSSDKLRRTRGRRGLEVMSKLQNNSGADVRMHETQKGEFKGMSVDQRLVALAQQIGGRIVTNDFNLNKVAGVQGIPVINLNDVANTLKPRYLPGERLSTKIIKEGESHGQGVGYLDDGTMVVCEQANNLIGKDIEVLVTSVLQSSAGRMIFGRQVHSTSR